MASRAILAIVVISVGCRTASAIEFSVPNPWEIVYGLQPATPPIDASAVCFPDPPSAEILERWPDLDSATPGRLREILGQLDEALSVTAPPIDPETGVRLRWVLAARTERDRDGQVEIRRALLAIARLNEDPRVRRCLYLEAARIALLQGLNPEAVALAQRAAPLVDHSHEEHTVLWIRAEALYQAGRRDEAAPLFARLDLEATERLRKAARLRSADLSTEAGRGKSALARYAELLPEAESFGAESSAWGPRAGEAAFQNGRFLEAVGYFRRYAEYQESAAERGLAQIRVADSAALAGRLPAATALLRDLSEVASDESVRTLAAVRLSVPPVGTRTSEIDIERLRGAGSSRNARVARHARGELARALLETGEPESALELLTELAFEEPRPSLVPWLDALLGEALQAVAENAQGDDACLQTIERIGWRRDFLLQRSLSAAPFFSLGACYERAGLPSQAIGLYRAMVKRFGLKVSEAIALPLARSALAASEIGVARAAAEARVSAGAGGEWQLLLARVRLAEGAPKEARDLLQPLLVAGTEVPLRRLAIEVFNASLQASDAVVAERETLLRNATWLEDSDADPLRAHAQWLAAEAERRSGRPDRARPIYKRALTTLPPGSRRAQSHYWLGVLDPDPEQAREEYRVSAEMDGPGVASGAAWSKLAAEELGLAKLRERHGIPPSPDAATRPEASRDE